MNLTRRMDRLEEAGAGPVRIGGWFDKNGRPEEPLAEVRHYVEREAHRRHPDRSVWPCAVQFTDDRGVPVVVLVGNRGVLQVIDVPQEVLQVLE